MCHEVLDVAVDANSGDDMDLSKPRVDAGIEQTLSFDEKTGVVVLEWRRNERVLPLDPRAPLREADVLALAGTRDQILRSRSL